jgi:hypothetical protein
MEMQQGGWLAGIEHSWLGVLARESVWLYPAANVLHILGLTVLAASVAMMDARLLGAFREAPPAPFIARVRVFAVAALVVMLLTGSVLFAAEATHVAANPVFRIKLVLIVAAILNALVFELAGSRSLADVAPGAPTPIFARVSATLSLSLWLTVASAGRLIAYF